MGFKSPKTPKAKPEFTGLQLNSSSSVIAVPIAGGQGRLAFNLIDYLDFASHEHKEKVKTGKGFGGGSTTTTTYTYSVTPLLALCEGEIAGVGRAWKDKGEEADYATLGFSLFTGPTPQSPWGYLTTAHPDHALGYPGTAYLAAANFDLGSGASLPQMSFEVQGLLYGTASWMAGGEADAALWIQEFLTNTQWGLGFPVAYLDLDQLLEGTDSPPNTASYQTYCRVQGFGLNPVLVDQEAAGDLLERWALITNAAPVWTGFSLKLVPYGDAPIPGDVSFTPDTAIRYDFTDDDYVQSSRADGPVEGSITDPSDVKNVTKLEVLDRANAYNPVPVTFQDTVSIELIGRREAEVIKAHEICDLSMAQKVVDLIGGRTVNIRNHYRFTVDPRYGRLEPMDVVTITDAPMGLDQLPVRILSIEEDEADNLTLDCEEFPGLVNHSSSTALVSGVTPNPVNSLVASGDTNPPIIFEPNADLAFALFGSRNPCLVAAVSGGDGTTADPNWGGALVHVSTDGLTFDQIGTIVAPARMGKTTAILAAYASANPDTVHTLGVDMAMSAGTLASATSSADAAAGANLSWVDGEVLSFLNATLTGANAYDLGTELYRGLYGSTPGAHASASQFTRLDERLFRFELPAAYIGVTLTVKFQSFNIFGQSLQDLADATPYTVTPEGTGFGSGAAGTPAAASSPTVSAAPGQNLVTWPASPASENVTSYSVWRADGLGASFGAASELANVGLATFYADTAITPGADYTYFVVAHNVVGAGSGSAGEDHTSSPLSAGPAGAPITASEAITAPALVNVWNSSGSPRVRYANATAAGKEASGYILASVANGGTATVYADGQIAGLSGLTAGEVFLAIANGQITNTAPSASGNIVQRVGDAVSATVVDFDPGEDVLLR